MSINVSVTIEAAAFAATGGGWTLASAPPVVGGGERTLQPGTGPQPIGPAGAQPQGAPGFGSNALLFMFVPLFLLLILMSSFGARKEKKKRAAMLQSLGRYDRVQTMGGLIGTIIELKDDEVILKVDESTNTKIHFSRSAVQSVLDKKSRSSDELTPAETTASV